MTTAQHEARVAALHAVERLKRAIRTERNDNGPDAHHVLPGLCPLCEGDVAWSDVLKWRYYPDGGVVFVDCHDCGFGAEVDLR